MDVISNKSRKYSILESANGGTASMFKVARGSPNIHNSNVMICINPFDANTNSLRAGICSYS